MNGAEFKAWRKVVQNWTQKHAAYKLGVGRSTLIQYEKNFDDPIPKPVKLACFALTAKIENLDAATILEKYITALRDAETQRLALTGGQQALPDFAIKQNLNRPEKSNERTAISNIHRTGVA